MKVKNIFGLISNIVSAECDGASITGAVLDSRKVEKGNIFFAVKGNNVDGNLFAEQALKAGASVAVMDNKDVYRTIKGNKILVKDTVEAIKSLGKSRLAECLLARIAITGSYGKTGTKEMLKHVLSTTYKVYATSENNNNELGVLLTACGVPNGTDIVIFELGSNGVGEIGTLAELVKPNIAIITGVGHAHVGKFGNLAITAQEKLSVIDHLADNGVIVANDMFYHTLQRTDYADIAVTFGRSAKADIRLTDYNVVNNKTLFKMSTTTDEMLDCMLPTPYVHLAENFLAVFAVARLLNVDYQNIVKAAQNYVVPKGRGAVITYGNLTIIDDCYNASLEAVDKAIDALALMGQKKKYALIGEIGEIDGYEDKIYDAIYEKAKSTKNIHFILSGKSYSKYSEIRNVSITAGEYDTKFLLNVITEGVILVKASRSYGFEKYINYLTGGRDAI